MPFIPKFARRSRRLKGPLETPDLIVVGLGNPEPHYLNTRHNAGWWLVDALAKRHGIEILRAHSTARLGVGKTTGGDESGGASRVLALAKPRTHVNGSGAAVRYLLARFGVQRDRLLVVYDEAALPPGRLRLRPEGGAAGHNGVKSIISELGGQDFARLRIGVGRPPPGGDMVGWALGEPSAEDRELIEDAVERGADAVLTVLNEGVESAMNRFN